MTSYEGLNILITGSTGYIGSTLVKSFNSIDCNLIISTGDVSKKETWNDIIKDDIDIIYKGSQNTIFRFQSTTWTDISDDAFYSVRNTGGTSATVTYE